MIRDGLINAILLGVAVAVWMVVVVLWRVV